MNCPKCGAPLSEDAKFCGACGAAVTEAPASAPRYETAPTAEPAAPSYRAADVYTGSAPAKEKTSGAVLTGMILGIIGAVHVTLALIFAIAALSGSYYRIISDAASALVFAAISLPLGIVALVLSGKGKGYGKDRAFGKVGKITGLVTTILSGVILTIAIIALASVS